MREEIERFLKREPKGTFTVEEGRGATYRNNTPTLYGHSTYKRGSVLAGQPSRTFLTTFNAWPDADAAWRALPIDLRRKVTILDGPTTYVPADTLCDRAGVPHDEDY